ncbi:MAG: 2-C-methyl-D-erythritol 2,4-cyclodiphosphate synthase [Defluviitaleaceae bacterium]|nr:2-C-methyl-D-erythritol 2,4-cyclodiphosphate synthase [Defluviitaleaceae bacterium]
MRIGIGYDVHKFEKDRSLIIGGVLIPFEMGLLGHSDADVLVHAIMDSILGALKKGDIGRIFPDNDDNFKGISSLVLLEQVKGIMENCCYKIVNIDCIIIAQKPKMMPFIPLMEKNIAKILDTNIENINIKATTEEGLGFTGNLEGIAAKAVCLLEKV